MKTVTETPAALSSPGGVNRFRYRNGRIYRTSSTLRLVRHYKRPAHASFIIYYLYSGRVAAFACRQISPANISRQTFYFFVFWYPCIPQVITIAERTRAHRKYERDARMSVCRWAECSSRSAARAESFEYHLVSQWLPSLCSSTAVNGVIPLLDERSFN